MKKVIVSACVALFYLTANVSAASPAKAASPNPANSATGVSTTAALSWTAGAGTTSHDVYFGTNQSDVTNTNRLLGDLNGNGVVDWNDISQLTDYWLLDPAGSQPYAGVNDDNTVDFFDYALLAQDWKTSANSVFKGNQDANTYNPSALAPNTTYYWRIDEVNSSGTTAGDVWNFTTAASGPEFTFVHASDPQMNWDQCGPAGSMDYLWGVTINKINNINPAFVIVTGDLINTNSSTTQTATYKGYAAGINPLIPIYTVPGNHDISDPSNSTKYAWWLSNLAYPTGLTNPWYSFTYGDSIFIGLDSGVFKADWGGKQAAELAWLTTTLQNANTAGYTHKFVFMHVALFVSSAGEAYDSAGNLPLAIRQTLLNLFHQYGVKVVMAGHRHTNNYGVDGDLQMFTTTSCTCGLGSPRTPPGIRIFKVYSDHIEQEVRTLDSLP